MRLSTKLSGIVAIGGVAALGAGLISSGGIGAAFTDSATANATFAVGNLDCDISSTADGAVVSGNSVTIPLGLVTSSVAGQKTAPVTVKNSGTIPIVVSWNVATFGQFFRSDWAHTYLPVNQNKSVGTSTERTYTIGAQWDELDNADLNSQGLVKYTAICSDQPATLWFSDNAGGTHEWQTVNNEPQLKLTVLPASQSQYGGVGVHIVEAMGKTLPDQQPEFTQTTTPTPSGALRLRIDLSDNSSIIINSDGTWNGGAAAGDWNAFKDAHDGATVTGASLIADTSMSSGFTTNVTCLRYSDEPIFGVGC